MCHIIISLDLYSGSAHRNRTNVHGFAIRGITKGIFVRKIIAGSIVNGETFMSDQSRIINDMGAEILPKSALIGYAQSGKCNERQASNYADSNAFIRSTNQAVRGSNPLERANLFSESANSLSPRLSY